MRMMTNMNIAIVTIYDLNNYGNRLQNYATVKFLQNCGYSVETIILDYNTLSGSVKNLIKKIIGIKTYRDWNMQQEEDERVNSLSENQKRRYRNFYKFTYEHIPPRYIRIIEGVPSLKIRKYDYFLVGSDQVWNPEIAQARPWEFLCFAPPTKRVAWCASFGIEEIEDMDYKIGKELKKFRQISVREKSGAQLVEKLSGRKAEVLIDPTLMLTAQEWLEVAEEPNGYNLPEKYILTYFLGNKTFGLQREIGYYANELDAEVVDLLDESNQKLYSAGPEVFVYLIANAKLVLTDSFHACVFSFLFQKPFLVYERNEINKKNMMSRIDTLLETFDLRRKFRNSGLDNEILEANYEKGYRALETEREKVKKYISQLESH